MSRFTGGLYVKLLEEGDEGFDEDKTQWVLLRPFVYHSDIVEQVFVVPTGFITDFASVPRVPLAYLLAGDTAHKAAALHDFLYSDQSPVARAVADGILEEAAGVTHVPAWRRALMYVGVRIGGWLFYKGKPVNS